jgi:hypothetical protein
MADFDREEWLKNLKVGDSVREKREAASKKGAPIC